MNQSHDFKYAPFTSPNASVVAKLPTPSAYRQLVPVFQGSESPIKTRRFERKRLIRWFAVAVALHVALFVGIWLTPPLRLKWSPAPEQWVSIMSLPAKAPEASIPPAVKATTIESAKQTQPSRTKAKGPKAKSAAKPSAAPPSTIE